MRHEKQGTIEYFVGERMPSPLSRLEDDDFLVGYHVDELRLEDHFQLVRDVGEPGLMLEVEVTAGKHLCGQRTLLSWDGEYYRDVRREWRFEIALLPVSELFRSGKVAAFLRESNPIKREQMAAELRALGEKALRDDQAGLSRSGR